MSAQLIFFGIVALVAILAAGGMLLSRNAVHSALFLVLNFASVAILYMLLNAPFISVSQVTVYAVKRAKCACALSGASSTARLPASTTRGMR